MSLYKEFGELKLPSDLLKKLDHDVSRMENSPHDQYAAFDFFVTAEHIVDWIYPDSKREQNNLRSSSALLRITSHIANGAKHFEAKASHHQSVTGIEKERYFESGYIEEGYSEDPLFVHLTEEESVKMNTSTKVKAIWLARQVLEYWRNSDKLA